ncbi:hypothetical protein RJT34_32007 [Clitoria ternatea]|uniref:Uncharacterized protein n=1 Tax=Clitoria ternatea TaxID=43366 RepID=A0AAN9I1V6_CLITE
MQKPNSFNDALKLAFDFEKLRSVRGKKETVAICGFCKGPHEEHSCKVGEEMREVWRHSKQKEWSYKVAKDLVRSFSMGESSHQGKFKTDGEKGCEAVVGSVKKNQCQWPMHQTSMLEEKTSEKQQP